MKQVLESSGGRPMKLPEALQVGTFGGGIGTCC